MGSISNNADFQSELLRINGTLQASITELRYHCEVYRLSLKSITKVLDSVQRDQDGRLRYLTTSRPSFQAYLLNLSQKQALDRIKNVVRKASTFINGYSLVDKRLFQPPPPKPSTARRSSDENKNAPSASTTDNAKLTDGSGLGWASKSCSSPGIFPVIVPHTLESKEHIGAGAGSSKNNKGKVERKHSRSKRRREKRDKMSGKSYESRGRVGSRSSRHKRSGSSSDSMPGDIKRKRKSDASNDDDSSYKEIKRSQKEKGRSKSSSKNCFSLMESIKFKDGDKRLELQSTIEQTRSKSIGVTSNHHDNHHHDRRHYHHQVINFRTLSHHYHDEDMKQDHNETKLPRVMDEPSDGRKQQSPFMSQSNGSANRIPPLFRIATIKTPGSSHENLRTESRRAFRPSKEKQCEARKTAGSYIRANDQTNECDKKRSQNDISSPSVCAIPLNGTLEAKTSRRTTTRWSNSNTITAKKVGYKVRESLAVLRNRNSGNARQGQGVVARKYLFSSHKPSNNFKLNSATVSNTTFLSSPEKVWRIQLSGENSSRRNDSFIGSGYLKDEKPYGASRKRESGSISGNGNCGNTSNSEM